MTPDLSRLIISLVASAAADNRPSGDGSTPSGLSPVDWAIIALYAAGTIGLGWYYARRQKNRQEYFVGNRRMNPLLIGVSLFATLRSTISYLASPGDMIGKGPTASISYVVTLPLAFLVVGFVVIPIYMRQRVTTAYELLEERLDVGTRLLGATMFLVLRLMWMSLLVYMAAAAMTVIGQILRGVVWYPSRLRGPPTPGYARAVRCGRATRCQAKARARLGAWRDRRNGYGYQ